MLDSLITSQTRIKLLLKFFMNSSTRAYLRGLESEWGDSTNGIRVELNRLEQAGILVSVKEGNRKLYQANKKHPLFNDIHNLMMKETGLDKIIEKVVARIGNLCNIYLTGDFAHGINSRNVDLILVGDDIDKKNLGSKIIQAEKVACKTINCRILSLGEAYLVLNTFNPCDLLVVWSKDKFSENDVGKPILKSRIPSIGK